MAEAEEINEEFAEPFISTVDENDEETIDILRRKSKQRPYHAIMRILLFVWPLEEREKVTAQLKELRELKCNEQQWAMSTILLENLHTRLVWAPDHLNVETYYSYVNRHKSYVKQGFDSFNELVICAVKPRLYTEGYLRREYYPELDPTEEQIKVHDDSKYSFVETVTYAMRWYPCSRIGSDKCDDDAWDTGLQHHYCHNEHHPEHWGTKCMYWRYILEALYDMTAMELEKKFSGHVPENRAKLLEFDDQFLQRFNVTHQLEFIKKIIEYTTEAYYNRNKQFMPSSQSTPAPTAPSSSSSRSAT